LSGRLSGWIPTRIHGDGSTARVDWCYLGPRRFVEPFYRDTIQSAMQKPFNQAFWQETPIDALVAWARERPGMTPNAFIYHASRCGSTLVARMLMSLASHVVVSEPPPVDSVLGANAWRPGVSDEDRRRWLTALLSALGQPRAGSETRFVIKLDAWHVVDWRFLAHAPGVPSIFLYRDPVEIAVSQLAMPGAYMVPGILGPSQCFVPLADAVTMPRVEFVARVLGRIFEAGLEACADGHARAVHYVELPDALWSSLADLSGVDRNATTRVALREAAVPDAKNPHFTFAGDRSSKQASASAELREAIERPGTRWDTWSSAMPTSA
jgi:hypothetical protein